MAWDKGEQFSTALESVESQFMSIKSWLAGTIHFNFI